MKLNRFTKFPERSNSEPTCQFTVGFSKGRYNQADYREWRLAGSSLVVVGGYSASVNDSLLYTSNSRNGQPKFVMQDMHAQRLAWRPAFAVC